MGNPILGKDKPKKWIKKEHIPIESLNHLRLVLEFLNLRRFNFAFLSSSIKIQKREGRPAYTAVGGSGGVRKMKFGKKICSVAFKSDPEWAPFWRKCVAWRSPGVRPPNP